MVLAERPSVPYALIPDLPTFVPRLPYPVNLYELVPHLVTLYPEWDERDVVDFLEERTGQRVHPEDLITLRVLLARVR